MSPLAYAFIAMAAAFGGVSAFVLLSPRPVAAPPAAQPQAATQAQAPVGPAEGIPPPPPDPDAPAPVEGTAQPGGAVQPRPGGPVGARSPEKPAASAAIDTSGFGNSGVSGPSAAGPSGAGPSSSLGQLSHAEISGVVESNRPGVRRRCWQPALEARAANAPSTARVSASIVIAPSGAVQSVSAGGSERDYPGLSSCIAARINTWKFPPSSGSTPVNIPFVFASQ